MGMFRSRASRLWPTIVGMSRVPLIVVLVLTGCSAKLFDTLADETETGCNEWCDNGGDPHGQTCDPIAQDCAGGLACLPEDSDAPFQCQPLACDLGMELPCGSEGDPCQTAQECVPGLICLAGPVVPSCGAAACCVRLCDLEAPMCPLGSSCQPYGDEPTIEHVGACVLP
jgi:hypothetical protein